MPSSLFLDKQGIELTDFSPLLKSKQSRKKTSFVFAKEERNNPSSLCLLSRIEQRDEGLRLSFFANGRQREREVFSPLFAMRKFLFLLLNKKEELSRDEKKWSFFSSLRRQRMTRKKNASPLFVHETIRVYK